MFLGKYELNIYAYITNTKLKYLIFKTTNDILNGHFDDPKITAVYIQYLKIFSKWISLLTAI